MKLIIFKVFMFLIAFIVLHSAMTLWIIPYTTIPVWLTVLSLALLLIFWVEFIHYFSTYLFAKLRINHEFKKRD